MNLSLILFLIGILGFVFKQDGSLRVPPPTPNPTTTIVTVSEKIGRFTTSTRRTYSLFLKKPLNQATREFSRYSGRSKKGK
jgi:hypothetical protein